MTCELSEVLIVVVAVVRVQFFEPRGRRLEAEAVREEQASNDVVVAVVVRTIVALLHAGKIQVRSASADALRARGRRASRLQTGACEYFEMPAWHCLNSEHLP